MKFKIKSTVSDSFTVHKAPILDPRLSFKGKGIYAALRSFVDGDEFTIRDIANLATDGAQGVKSGLKELHAFKYIKYNIETAEITVVANPNITSYKPLDETKTTKQKNPKKTREDWVKQRTEERKAFSDLVIKEVKEMKNPRPSIETVRDFIKYWGAIDSMDPSRPLPFQKKQKKNGVFNIKLTMRTKMRMEKIKTESQEKTKDDGL